MLTSDLHLGHRNINKYRDGFSSQEEHDNTLFENLATGVNKRDTLYLLGDICFTKEWLEKVSTIKCNRKVLVCGNHDIERGINMKMLVQAYDDVKPFFSHRNFWFSHCPIHPSEVIHRLGNIHGHTHQHHVRMENGTFDTRYFNVSVDVTEFKPISFEKLMERWL
jgi:calcineurin-like phosphoesterase family protein